MRHPICLLYYAVSDDQRGRYRSSTLQRDRIEVKVAMLSFINAAIPRSSDEAATAVCSRWKWDHWQSNCRYQVIASRRVGGREREGNTVILNRHLVSRRTLRSLPFSSFRPSPFSLSPFSRSPSSSPRSARTFTIPYVATRARWFSRGRYLHRRIFGVLRTYVFVHTRPGRYCQAVPCGRHANPKKWSRIIRCLMANDVRRVSHTSRTRGFSGCKYFLVRCPFSSTRDLMVF